jgi:hypothetical protein
MDGLDFRWVGGEMRREYDDIETRGTNGIWATMGYGIRRFLGKDYGNQHRRYHIASNSELNRKEART